MQRISAGPCQTVPRQRFYEMLGSSELISFETFFSFFIKHSKSAVLTAGMHRVLPGRHEFPTVHGWGGGFPGCEPPAPPMPEHPPGSRGDAGPSRSQPCPRKRVVLSRKRAQLPALETTDFFHFFPPDTSRFCHFARRSHPLRGGGFALCDRPSLGSGGKLAAVSSCLAFVGPWEERAACPQRSGKCQRGRPMGECQARGQRLPACCWAGKGPGKWSAECPGCWALSLG